jgi:hypothetical protein
VAYVMLLSLIPSPLEPVRSVLKVLSWRVGPVGKIILLSLKWLNWWAAKGIMKPTAFRI